MSGDIRSEPVVLVAEDEADDALLIERAFMRGGVAAQLQFVRDGDQAVAYMGGQPPFVDRDRFPFPNLLLLDLKMPRRSGHEVLQWARAGGGVNMAGGGADRLRRLPVVVLTSSRETPDVHRAFDLGANSYLVKPVSTDGLLHLVRTLGVYWFSLSALPDSSPGA